MTTVTRLLLTFISAVTVLIIGASLNFYANPTITTVATLAYRADHWVGNPDEAETIVEWNHPITGERMSALANWEMKGVPNAPYEKGDTLTIEVHPVTGELVGNMFWGNAGKTFVLLTIGLTTGFILSLLIELTHLRLPRRTQEKYITLVHTLKKELV